MCISKGDYYHEKIALECFGSLCSVWNFNGCVFLILDLINAIGGSSLMQTLSKIVSNIATVLMCGALFGYGELGDAPIKILMGAGALTLYLWSIIIRMEEQI